MIDQSVKLNVLRNRTYSSLLKESQLNKENKLIRTKQGKEYHHDIVNENQVAESINAIDNDSSQSKESSAEDFRLFKKPFFAEVNVFKQPLLTSWTDNTTDNVNKSNVDKSNSSCRLIILLEKPCFPKGTDISKK